MKKYFFTSIPSMIMLLIVLVLLVFDVRGSLLSEMEKRERAAILDDISYSGEVREKVRKVEEPLRYFDPEAVIVLENYDSTSGDDPVIDSSVFKRVKPGRTHTVRDKNYKCVGTIGNIFIPAEDCK
jgi:hypothetical protein